MLFRIFDVLLKALFFVLIVGTLGIAFFRPDLLISAVEWLGRMVAELGWWNYPIVFGIAAGESFPVVGTFLPGQNAMLVVAGFHARVDLVGTVLAAMLGACFGNWLGFMAGRLWGTAFLERYGEWFALGRTERRILHERIERNGIWFIVVGKFHPLSRAFVPFLAGAGGMGSTRFWLYNFLGSMLWACVIVGLGTFFVAYYRVVLAWIQYVILGIVVAAIAYAYFFRREAFDHYVAEKRAEIEESAKPR